MVDNCVSLQYNFTVGYSTIYHTVPDMLKAIVIYYHDNVVMCPTSIDDCKKMEWGFRERDVQKIK